MPKFEVYGLLTGSKYLGEFEAATEAEAIEMALASGKNHVSLCHQCSHDFDLDEHSAHDATASKID